MEKTGDRTGPDHDRSTDHEPAEDVTGAVRGPSGAPPADGRGTPDVDPEDAGAGTATWPARTPGSGGSAWA
ncbi:hypothetical protein [Phycicoccus flavus]|uniref:Uncharacterized protein n=1 Tax=Phycicoccus flavus TaxID=2502783 RepID=A0A8T6R615_9MICO|nr:hypothetical protein [Phycicoccus flavus]NHA69013.1 hypothetical protein [Phycicoccus flavus]